MATVCVDPDDFETDVNGRLQVKKGCGLTGSPDGVAADVTAWPYDCDQEANASRIFCSPTTGRLQGEPRDRTLDIRVSEIDTDAHVLNTVDDRFCLVTGTDQALDLGDWCESGVAMLSVGGSWVVSNNDIGANFNISIEESFDGNPFTTLYNNLGGGTIAAGNGAATHRGSFFGPRVITVLTPAFHNYRVRLCIDNNSNLDLTVDLVKVEIHGLVMTRNAS